MNGVNNQHTSTFTTTWATRDVLYPLVCCCLAAAQVTGLVYINEKADDFISQLNTVDRPLATLPQEETQPGPEALQEIMESLM